jgi:hypothetical protein
MAVYDKNKSFSIGWVIGGAVIMFLTNFFGGFVCGAAGVTSIDTILIVALVCYAIGGFVIGWQSEGQTIIEAGIAAALCVVVMGTIRGIWSHVDAQTLGLAVAIPFVPAVVGAWLGEKVQGDTIETQD